MQNILNVNKLDDLYIKIKVGHNRCWKFSNFDYTVVESYRQRRKKIGTGKIIWNYDLTVFDTTSVDCMFK